MKLLITAIGRRVQLINYLKKNCTIIGADSGETAPAIDFVDKFYKVPKYNDDKYIEKLIEVCKIEEIQMLIPLFEKEFSLLCKHRDEFLAVGTILMLSSTSTIDICNDKWKTYWFFKDNNIDTPFTCLKQDIPEELKYPVIIKPFDGMGSSNVFKVKNKEELDFFKEYVNSPVIQEFIEGIEYTIDTLSDLIGNVIAVVPRVRLEVRSGEVSKSRTVKKENIIKETIEVCNKLKLVGPCTIQCIETKQGKLKFLEINPRFGGGVPLTFEAGVEYGRFFNEMIEGKVIEPIIGNFKELSMFRYEEAVFK